MTYEEARDICRMALKCFGNRHSEFVDESVIKRIVEIYDIEVMLNAIEKQIPKKPLNVQEHHVIYFNWQCPTCERRYVNSINGIRHCVDCGQAIDWSEEETE